MHIHLDKNIWLNSDTLQYWLTKETTRKNKKGEDTVYRTVITGYHSDLERLFADYFDRTVRAADIEGEIDEVAKLIKKTRNEIRKWMKQMRGED